MVNNITTRNTPTYVGIGIGILLIIALFTVPPMPAMAQDDESEQPAPPSCQVVVEAYAIYYHDWFNPESPTDGQLGEIQSLVRSLGTEDCGLIEIAQILGGDIETIDPEIPGAWEPPQFDSDLQSYLDETATYYQTFNEAFDRWLEARELIAPGQISTTQLASDFGVAEEFMIAALNAEVQDPVYTCYAPGNIRIRDGEGAIVGVTGDEIFVTGEPQTVAPDVGADLVERLSFLGLGYVPMPEDLVNGITCLETGGMPVSIAQTIGDEPFWGMSQTIEGLGEVFVLQVVWDETTPEDELLGCGFFSEFLLPEQLQETGVVCSEPLSINDTNGSAGTGIDIPIEFLDVQTIISAQDDFEVGMIVTYEGTPPTVGSYLTDDLYSHWNWIVREPFGQAPGTEVMLSTEAIDLGDGQYFYSFGESQVQNAHELQLWDNNPQQFPEQMTEVFGSNGSITWGYPDLRIKSILIVAVSSD